MNFKDMVKQYIIAGGVEKNCSGGGLENLKKFILPFQKFHNNITFFYKFQTDVTSISFYGYINEGSFLREIAF